jgi:hypothetical protein
MKGPAKPIFYLSTATSLAVLGDSFLYAILPGYFQHLGLLSYQVGILTVVYAGPRDHLAGRMGYYRLNNLSRCSGQENPDEADEGDLEEVDEWTQEAQVEQPDDDKETIGLQAHE